MAHSSLANSSACWQDPQRWQHASENLPRVASPGTLMFRIQNYTKKQGQRALCPLFIWVYGESGRERKERTLLSKVSVPEAVPTCTSCPCTQECTPFLWVPLRQLTLAGQFSCSFPAGLRVLDGECLWQVTSLFLSIALLFSAAVPGPPDSRRPLHTEHRNSQVPLYEVGQCSWSRVELHEPPAISRFLMTPNVTECYLSS